MAYFPSTSGGVKVSANPNIAVFQNENGCTWPDPVFLPTVTGGQFLLYSVKVNIKHSLKLKAMFFDKTGVHILRNLKMLHCWALSRHPEFSHPLEGF